MMSSFLVLLEFFVQGPAGFGDLVTMVEVLDGLFEADGDEKADDDAQLVVLVDALDGLFEADGDEQAEDNGGDVDEEVAPGRCGVVGWVDVEHRGLLLRILPSSPKTGLELAAALHALARGETALLDWARCLT